MGILHSVFGRHSVFIIPNAFPPLRRAPALGILWPQTLLDELEVLSDRLQTQNDVGKLLPIDDLYRLKSLLQLATLPLNETLRTVQLTKVQKCIDLHMALWRIQKAILDGDRGALDIREMEAAIKIMERALKKTGKRPRRRSSGRRGSRSVSLY